MEPSNDNDPNVQIEIALASAVSSDASWVSYEWIQEYRCGWSWDPTVPLAEQWPWNGKHGRTAESDPLPGAAPWPDDLIAALSELPPADQLDAEQCPPVAADASERIAEVTGDLTDDEQP